MASSKKNEALQAGIASITDRAFQQMFPQAGQQEEEKSAPPQANDKKAKKPFVQPDAQSKYRVPNGKGRVADRLMLAEDVSKAIDERIYQSKRNGIKLNRSDVVNAALEMYLADELKEFR